MSSPYATTTRPEIHQLLPATPHFLLDVGCNDGGFGAWLKRIFPDVVLWGVETNHEQAAKAAHHLDRVIVAPFPDALSDLDATFDCVTFNHVLEHIADPWDALARTASVLNPDGQIVGVIPNVQYFPVLWNVAVRGRWDYTDSGILDRTHLRFFTEKSVRDLIESSGLRVIEILPVNGFASQRYPRLSRALAKVCGNRAYGGFAFSAALR